MYYFFVVWPHSGFGGLLLLHYQVYQKSMLVQISYMGGRWEILSSSSVGGGCILLLVDLLAALSICQVIVGLRMIFDFKP
jgi:hypothetical protein